MGKTKKVEPDLKWWTPQASPASPHGGQDIKSSLKAAREAPAAAAEGV